MKEKIIETIRAVPIAGKTYEEYVEALAAALIERFDITTGSDYYPKMGGGADNEQR